MEQELFHSTIDQLKKTEMSKVENALMWLYLKTWGLQGQHVIDKAELWNFGGEDLEEAIIGIAYPRIKKNESGDGENESKEDLVDSLKKLIMGKFDEKHNEFYEWSRSLHNEVFIYDMFVSNFIAKVCCETSRVSTRFPQTTI